MKVVIHIYIVHMICTNMDFLGELSFVIQSHMFIFICISHICTVCRRGRCTTRERGKCRRNRYAKLQNNPSNYLWIVDPIDGTSNFVHGMPLCMPSMGEVVVGVIHDPHRNETFTAIRGQGAYMNWRRTYQSRKIINNR